MAEVKKAEEGPSDMPNMLAAKVALEAWKAENIGLRPKISTWNECDTAIFTGLSKCWAAAKVRKKRCRR